MNGKQTVCANSPAVAPSFPATASVSTPAGWPLAGWRRGAGAAVLSAVALWPGAWAQSAGPGATADHNASPAAASTRMTLSNVSAEPILEAREAFRKRDRVRLAAARAQAMAMRHPLAMWVDYWDLNARLWELQAPEADAFLARWPNTYVEDRFRNDWLLELGRRRDWAAFAVHLPQFRMQDDRDVACYALLLQHLAGKDIRDAARSAWLAQRDGDEGCATLAATLVEARQFTAADLWTKARFATDNNKPRATRQAAVLVSAAAAEGVDALYENPARYLARKASAGTRADAELATLALMRLAANDLDAAQQLLNSRWEKALPSDLAGWAWAAVAKHTALKLQPEAPSLYDRAERLAERGQPRRDAREAVATGWTDEMLGWRVRALLRQNTGTDADLPRWAQVRQTIDALSPSEQKDGTWRYWKARALQVDALERKGLPPAQADAQIAQARTLLEALSNEMHFYGVLAAEDLGRSARLPPAPGPLTAEERVGAVRHPGLERGLQLIGIGLRGEGVREWNYSLRGMNDRELLAAAQWACDREVWDRCINTSERSTADVDLAQRFPLPYRREVVARTREIGLDAAYVYGLIRQESRFIMDVRSSVGASGLMQVMPATAKWTANKIGLAYSPDMITDRDTNLMLGTSYLKLVLDDLGGSQAMGAAAYNAGPNRLRRWREGPRLDPVVWAENIPFNETRDYVKKVLTNALYYAARLGNGEPGSLRARLGQAIGPRDASAPPAKELP